MKKQVLIGIIFLITTSCALAQSDSFDVYKYKTPQYFTRTVLPSKVQFSYKEKDTTFCIISIFKSQRSQGDTLKDITAQWNEYVVKPFSKADKKPGKIMNDQVVVDGWGSSMAIGNFYQNKKKCVVFITSFRKGNTTACVVYAFSYKLARGPVETFSKNLHLKNNTIETK